MTESPKAAIDRVTALEKSIDVMRCELHAIEIICDEQKALIDWCLSNPSLIPTWRLNLLEELRLFQAFAHEWDHSYVSRIQETRSRGMSDEQSEDTLRLKEHASSRLIPVYSLMGSRKKQLSKPA